MPETDKILDDNLPSEWFVRINDGDIYGPVDLETLQQWSEQGRIEPENEISEDQNIWIAAEELPELEIDWMTELEDETIFGPFNIQLAPELLKRGVLSTDSILKNRKTGAIHSMNPDNEETDSPTNSSPFADPRLPDRHNEPDLDTQLIEDEPTPTFHNTQTAADSPDPLAEIRKDLTKERATATVLQDNILRLQDNLNAAQSEKEISNNQLFEEQARLAESQAEVENLNAQLAQLQEHYDRIQEENKNQFESLDQLRAESMELEREYQHKVASEANRADIKTSLLAKTLHLIYQDKDLTDGNIPKALLGETSNKQTKELQMRVGLLQEQVEEEKKHNRQIDTLVDASRSKSPKNTIVILLAVVILILSIILAFTTKHQTPLQKTIQPPPKTKNQTSKIKHQTPSVEQQTKSIKHQASNIPPPISPSASLDLPPEDDTVASSSSTITTVNWPSIKLSRAKITCNSKFCSIVFTYGLFSKSTTITPEAKLDLAKLAKQLNGKIEKFTLIAEGHTDSTPISSPTINHIDNYALGMARAEAIKIFLETECNMPKGIIRTASAGESDPPYPNDTPASQRKNRTVVLTLIPPPK